MAGAAAPGGGVMSYRAWRNRRRVRQWRRVLAGLPHDLRVFVVLVMRAER